MSIKNDRWSALSLKDRADLMNMYITNGISDLKEMKKHYNSFAPGGYIKTDEYGYPADITPAIVEADYPREAEVWKKADASNADMVQRLKQGSSRVTIPDWEDPKKVATHKMMSAGNYAIGNVQNINGQLFDFTDPKHGFKDSDRAAINSAIERGDYIKFDTEGDARYFAEHYKKHYNSFSGEENTQIPNENTKQSKDFLFRWYANPTTRAIMNEAFPFEKVVPYYNPEGKEFTGESAVRGHVANAVYHTPEYIEKLEDNIGGRYIYDLNNPRIVYNEDYVYDNGRVDPRIATHELTHAVQRALPENTLRTSKLVKQELKKGVIPDEYLDSMTEIGARINSFREALNLTPEKRDYTPEDVEILMNTYIERFGEDNTSKLNRFTPETLAGYLNYLAYNDGDVIPTFNSDVNYANNGGKLLTKKKINLKIFGN